MLTKLIISRKVTTKDYFWEKSIYLLQAWFTGFLKFTKNKITT